MVCITLNGCTDIVYSSSVTLEDGLKKISSVRNVTDGHQPEDTAFTELPGTLDETRVLHDAATILRKLMS